MNSFDIIVLLLLTWGFINGFRKGLVIEVSRFLALILGLWVAFIFSREASLFLSNHIDISPQILNGISFILLFVLIVIAISILAKAMTKILKLAALGILNRMLGGVFGVLKWCFILSALVLIYEQINGVIDLTPPTFKENSRFYLYLLEFSKFSYKWVSHGFSN
tara:strand:- start:4708 stop:5199 length:492 start_codon:yes stop_codon:yes gene_type:complete